MVNEEKMQSPQNPKRTPNVGNKNAMFSPRFRSVAAMAGWDEEALLLASLVVEDTPERDMKHKKRVNLQFKSPTPNSRRKRRPQRLTPPKIPAVVLNLDDDETTTKDNGKKEGSKIDATEEKKKGEEIKDADSSAKAFIVPASGLVLPCIDKLKEELSCAICLEICFEPSTTSCGHSFCKKCLKSAADKCGKRCPKCRQIIGNARSCTVNTVLWNTIRLLFPEEIEARKAAGAMNSREAQHQSSEKHDNGVLSQRTSAFVIMNGDVSMRRRRGMPSQDEDAALALRLQREEFLGSVHRGAREQSRTTHIPRRIHEQPRIQISSSRENLRAMAERAMDLRIRRQQM